ncbi:hypothetical protein ACFVZ3_07830 [Kitasatospora purpeofusca]|uniref:hypothetical protein n=1 Tax=Kitasatospora purpeofusca TaxID=67352 RepID=UPI00369C6E78
MTAPDFDRIADELYTLAPADFTAARNERADDLRKADRQLAKRIRALHRPTHAAWAANLLTHRHPDLVGELLELGRALRDAQEHLTGERLRELVEQRRQLVRALTARAVQDAAAAGHPLGTGAVADLDGTLTAALADPDAADALAAGRLTTAVQPVAWPGAPEAPGRSPGTEAAPSPSARRSRSAPRAGEVPSSKAAAGAKAAAAAERQRLREVERAEEELAGAEQAQASAAGQAAAAERALEEAEAGQRKAEAEAERARAALEKARRLDARAQEDVDRAGERVRADRKTSHGAGEEAERAREAARDAADRVRDLKHRGDRPEQD